MLPMTKSYQKYSIESLKDPQEAALYTWAILQEENPDPDLLASALKDVAKAVGTLNMTPEETKLHLEKLDELMRQQGGEVIYGSLNWLKDLGLTLTVEVNEQLQDRHSVTESSAEIAA